MPTQNLNHGKLYFNKNDHLYELALYDISNIELTCSSAYATLFEDGLQEYGVPQSTTYTLSLTPKGIQLTDLGSSYNVSFIKTDESKELTEKEVREFILGE